jgi:hypothetical protein
LFVIWLLWSISAPASASDEFIAGYATGILQHEFGITDASVEVRDGEVVVTTKSLATIDRGKVVSALEQIPGVSHVEIRGAESAAPPPAKDAVETTIPTAGAKWLPHGALFAPLHADPRWPQFAGAYRQFTQGLNLAGVFAADFGETFAIYRNKAFRGFQHLRRERRFDRSRQRRLSRGIPQQLPQGSIVGVSADPAPEFTFRG